MIHNYPLQRCLWIVAVLTVSANLSHSESIRQERDLMVVLPVLQGRNISGEKLQYVYTKAPVTMMISDQQKTTSRPVSTNPWPASFASKAQVFLVEPSVRRTMAPHHTMFADWPRYTTTTTHRPSYSAVFWPDKSTPAKPPVSGEERVSSSNKVFDASVSKVTGKTSTKHSPTKWLDKETGVTEVKFTEQEDGNFDAAASEHIQTSALAANNTSAPNEKTVAQLASDLQESTNRLTNDIKSMLLHLGLLTQGVTPQLHGESNELWPEDVDSTKSDTDSSSYMKFKDIPIRDEGAIHDDMRQLLNTFGLLPNKNETNATENSLVRVSRDTKQQQPVVRPLNVHQLFEQADNKKNTSKSGDQRKRSGRPSTSVPLKTGLDSSTHKPLLGFRQHRIKEHIQTRAINGEASANKVGSIGSQSNSTGTASVEQLSGSFGGDPNEEQNSTPKQPTNGFYFWVDWNKFLNVTGKPNVKLHYSSRAGDPTKFIPINYLSQL